MQEAPLPFVVPLAWEPSLAIWRDLEDRSAGTDSKSQSPTLARRQRSSGRCIYLDSVITGKSFHNFFITDTRRKNSDVYIPGTAYQKATRIPRGGHQKVCSAVSQPEGGGLSLQVLQSLFPTPHAFIQGSLDPPLPSLNLGSGSSISEHPYLLA